MHLLFLLYDIHFVGGVERVTVNMANNFIDRGNHVTILSLSRKRPSNFFNLDDRVDITYFNYHFENGFNIPQKIASVLKVYNYFRKSDHPVIALGIGTTYPSLILAMLPRMKHLKTIGCQHCSYISAKHVWFFLRRLFYHRLNSVVSLTQHDLPRLKKLNQHSLIIPNSLTFYPEMHANLDNKIILSVGRMDYEKGFDLLLDVFEKTTASHPDWILRIIGDGPSRHKIVARVEASGLKERIEIVPSTNQILNHYLESSVYMMTSRSEALPMVLLEAQACGLPIIAFDCETGPAEIVNHGIDGYLVRPYDIEQMSRHLLELTSDPDKRKAFGAAARENVKRFSPDKIFNQWDQLFNHLQTPV